MRLQAGFSLLVVLVFLVVLGLLGFAVTQSAIMQQKITGNLNEKSLSFLAAEAAIRDASAYLQTADDASLPTASTSVRRSITSSALGTGSYVITASAVSGTTFYIVTASGTGRNSRSVTQLEAVFSIE